LEGEREYLTLKNKKKTDKGLKESENPDETRGGPGGSPTNQRERAPAPSGKKRNTSSCLQNHFHKVEDSCRKKRLGRLEKIPKTLGYMGKERSDHDFDGGGANQEKGKKRVKKIRKWCRN